MTSKEEQVRAVVAEQAAEWFVSNDEAPLDRAASAALIEWLRASPAHVEELLGVASIARDLHMAEAHPEFSVDTLLAREGAQEEDPIRSFWSHVFSRADGFVGGRWQTAAIAVLGIASLGLSLWILRPITRVSAPAQAAELHLETRHGEQTTYRLADNSVLHLNTDTKVTVRYSQRQRLVALTSGEAAFEVTHEPQRPFQVRAGPAEVLDLGTTFDVRLRADSAVITVVEGRVVVAPATMPATATSGSTPTPSPMAVQLGPNQQLSVSEGQWPATRTDVDARRATSWLHHQIMFDHEPLERVAAEFNRYASKPVEITTEELRKLEVTGTFSTDDPEEFIAFLRSLEGVRVDVTASRIRVSQK